MKQASMGEFRASLHSPLYHFKPFATETSKYFPYPIPKLIGGKKVNKTKQCFIQTEE